MLSRLAYNARIYGKLQLVHLRAHLEYEADFWIGIVGVVLTHGAGFVFVWAFFSSVPSIAGWSLWDTAFLYALSIIPRGLVEILCDGQWNLRMLVNRGEFDRLLVRPISPALQVITQYTSIHGFGSVILGVIILLHAAQQLGLAWSAWHYCFLLVTLLSSVVLISSVNFATNCIAFWDPSATGNFPFMIQNFLEFAKFPLSLYDRFVQVLVTWVLPFAFVSYYPGLVLLGKAGANPWLSYLAPLAGPIAALITAAIWRRGLRRYQGTGH
ncbi:MAG: ABC transporter permease [Roseiflexaceae bacterium]